MGSHTGAAGYTARAPSHNQAISRPSHHLPRLNAGSRPHRPRPQAVACSAAVAPPPAHVECAQLPAATPSGVTAAASVPEQVADNAARNVAAAVSPELHNQPGLNGLSACGTSGLTTGVFQINAVQPVRYVIEEVAGLFDMENETMLRGVVPDSFPCQPTVLPVRAPGQRRFIVIDDNVHRIYGERIEQLGPAKRKQLKAVLARQYFAAHGVECRILPLPTNEANKNFDLVFEIARQLEEFKLNRRKEPIVAIGGGVCLDVTGLAANLYRRNTPVIKVPTTVMAAVDASVGIKTAVNFENRKNKLGTYCPPLAVFIDRAFLKTLDQRNLSNGAAEMLKMACIKDAPLFTVLEAHGKELIAEHFQSAAASVAMRRSVQGMLEELEYNLWEHVLCRVVDYGHAFSPEIEMAALTYGDELLHGEAVNIDMALTTQLAYNRGLISLEERNRVYRVMKRLQLPFWHPVCCTALFYKGLVDTTKARDGLQRVPLMAGIGAAVFVNDLTREEIATAAAQMHALAAAESGAVSSNIVAAPPVAVDCALAI